MRRSPRRTAFAISCVCVATVCGWLIANSIAASAVEGKLQGVWKVVEVDRAPGMLLKDYSVTDHWEFQQDGPTRIYFALGHPMVTTAEHWNANRFVGIESGKSRATPADATIHIDLNPPRRPGLRGLIESLTRQLGIDENDVASYQLTWISDDECELTSTSDSSFAFSHEHVRLVRSDIPVPQ